MRWLAGIVTFAIGVAMFAVPADAHLGSLPGPSLFGGFLILCSVACAFPVPPVCRAVAAGITLLCLLLAACYTFTGRLPQWLWLLFHKRPAAGKTRQPDLDR
jgi:hypothetical protein